MICVRPCAQLLEHLVLRADEHELLPFRIGCVFFFFLGRPPPGAGSRCGAIRGGSGVPAHPGEHEVLVKHKGAPLLLSGLVLRGPLDLVKQSRHQRLGELGRAVHQPLAHHQSQFLALQGLLQLRLGRFVRALPQKVRGDLLHVALGSLQVHVDYGHHSHGGLVFRRAHHRPHRRLLKNSVDHLRNIKRLSIQIVLQQGLYTMEVCWLGVIKIEINVHILLAFSILVLFISVVGRIIPFTGTVIRR
mmetsp:Transcript_809/g.1718  ORF Transcript_809/g.1718 Transcript_809/m.1718 type:complete len:246 (-) Transcript_809:142-879(-)